MIKSGGKTRRAAKMVVLNVDHPDIVEFIRCKEEEEKKAWALIDAGYDSSLDGPAYGSVFFQNANNSVRVTDEFMQAVVEDRDVADALRPGRRGRPRRYQARELLRMIAEATHLCGDPGMQFDTTINDWHTCPNTGRINASNPCSEYMHLDNSACNLASLNLMKFVDESGDFDVEALPPRGRHHDHRAGHPGRQLELSDRGDHRQRARPSASSASATPTSARC